MPSKKKKNKNDGGQATQNEKGDRKTTPGADFTRSEETLNVYFNTDEIQMTKAALKLKDLTGIPAIICAAILNRSDVIGTLLCKGVNIDATDQNNTTALIWAVKCKNLESIETLLVNGADLSMRSTNGDHVLFVALDSKMWDEQSFIFLWNNISNVSVIDRNLLNRNGNSMLHMAVRREWTLFIDILIAQGVNVDITNTSGVTPLMLASFRNNVEILNRLVMSGANIGKQDNNGFVALCYAFSSAVTKNLQPPNLVIDTLLTELRRGEFSMESYLQRRVAMLVNPSNLLQNNGQPISGILLHVISYAVRYLEDGMQILMDLDIFRQMQKTAAQCIDIPERLKTILSVMHELLQYCEYCEHCRKPIVSVVELSDVFESVGCPDACFEIMKKYENNKTFAWLIPLCFRPIMQACLVKGKCHEWLQKHYEDLQQSYEQLRTFCFQNKNNDEFLYNKMRKFEVLMNLLISGEKICKKIVVKSNKDVAVNDETSPVFDSKSNSKKTKRRTKALKAKVAKMKTTELTERLNYTGRKLLSQASETSLVSDEPQTTNTKNYEAVPCQTKENYGMNPESDIVDSIKRTLFIGQQSDSELYCERAESKLSYSNVDWKSKILGLPFNAKPINCRDPEDEFYFKPDELEFLNGSQGNHKLDGDSLDAVLYPVFRYLGILLKKIVKKYQRHWEIDKTVEKELGKLTKIKNEKFDEAKEVLQELEKEKIELLEHEFNSLIAYIKEVAAKDLHQCNTLIKNVENVLLSHEIRGTTIISEVCPMETIFVSVSMPENVDLPSTNNAENALTKYMEDVLNNRCEPIDKINITITEPRNTPKSKNYVSDDVLYIKEMAKLPKAKNLDPKIISEAQKKTLKNAYHMQTSIVNVCDYDEEDMNKCNELDFGEYERMSKTILFFNKNAYQTRPELVFSDTFVDPLRKRENDSETSRWCTLVRSLEMMDNCQEFLEGTVRISCKEKRQSHVISTGGNFTPVELGLDACEHPLAVKRIPKGSCVCEMIKTMLVKLLELRHKNLLHYFACEYDNNELIIATPLCEYNVGQYLMLMKQNQTNLSALEVVKQFLTGLLFLHDRAEPIVHGNLKPSNIFVDINGVVKIAEFGIHRALFKFKEAPNSSIIWFATETYKTFKQLSMMECTCASDIQVAGMLVHFLMTAGKHPYGDDMRIILKNLDKAVPQLTANDLELQDLITWMLLYEPIERPNIQQVVTHVYFWSPERKWCFILTCAGFCSKTGTPPFKLDELHVCLEKVASKDNIKGKWVQVVKQQFPKISFTDNDDTPTGLLKFIRACMDSKAPLCFHTDLNLSNYILTSFPAFALSLYRMLENSVWVNHSTFSSFYSVDNIFT